jgi:hypothetical protein
MNTKRLLSNTLAAAIILGFLPVAGHAAANQPARGPAPQVPAPPAKPAISAAAAPQSATGVQHAAPARANRRIFFRYNGVDDNLGRLAFASIDRPDDMQFAGDLRCEVAYVAAERGICLTAEQRILGIFSAVLFDPATFKVLKKIPFQGLPSRARVAHGSRLAAFTVFTSGHGYGSANFSTLTALIDVPSATVLANLESFAVTKDATPFSNKDFNFWGVTFAPDARHFYATLSTRGQHYLVMGDPVTRTAMVIHSDVECPSVSPDGAHVAYKKPLLIPGRFAWELRSLDLASGRETSLAERRSIDDQLEWLDNDTVLYTVSASPTGAAPSTNVWRVAADGSGAPQLFLRNASSPSVVR